MKKVLLLFSFLIACGCSHTRRVSPEKFEEEYYKSKALLSHSLGDYRFAGMSEGGKVYLHKMSMSLLSALLFQEIYHDRIYISDFSALSPEVKKEIREIMIKQFEEMDKDKAKEVIREKEREMERKIQKEINL